MQDCIFCTFKYTYIVCQIETHPAGQPESIETMNVYQPTCNAFTRHSNDVKIKKPSSSNVISTESIIGKHIIQTCG